MQHFIEKKARSVSFKRQAVAGMLIDASMAKMSLLSSVTCFISDSRMPFFVLKISTTDNNCCSVNMREWPPGYLLSTLRVKDSML